MQTNYQEDNSEELLEDQATTVKKITPYKDVSWYIKWCASFLLIGAVIIRAADVLHFMDVLLSCIGTAMWGYVGYMWNEGIDTYQHCCLCYTDSGFNTADYLNTYQ